MKNCIKKGITALVLVVFTTTPLLAMTQETAEFRKNYGEVKQKVTPRKIDKTAVNLSNQFAAAKNTPQPHMGHNGAVVYQYGSTVTRVICRTLRITDIELEPGETVTSAPFIGDSVNWQVLPSASGSGDKLCYHIMIKPSMPDLSTNLVVHTDRRSYHFELVSSKTEHTPLIRFSYPQMQTQQGGTSDWQVFIAQRQAKKQAQENEYRVPYFDAGRMDDNYIIEGKKSIKWFPKRAYTDGVKTYIEFENNISNVEAPVFMIVRNGSREMVNYRQIGNIFVVDYLFDVGILLAGSGGQQQKVVIRKSHKIREALPPRREETEDFGMTETDENGKVIEKSATVAYAPRDTRDSSAVALSGAMKEQSDRLAEEEKKREIAKEKARLARIEAEKKAAAKKALAEKQARIKEEQKRLEAEKAEAKAKEQARLEAEKAKAEADRLEREKAEKALAEKEARLAEEQKKLEAEKAAARAREQARQEEEKARQAAREAEAKAEAEENAKLAAIQKKKLELLKRIEEIQKSRQQ